MNETLNCDLLIFLFTKRLEETNIKKNLDIFYARMYNYPFCNDHSAIKLTS